MTKKITGRLNMWHQWNNLDGINNVGGVGRCVRELPLWSPAASLWLDLWQQRGRCEVQTDCSWGVSRHSLLFESPWWRRRDNRDTDIFLQIHTVIIKILWDKLKNSGLRIILVIWWKCSLYPLGIGYISVTYCLLIRRCMLAISHFHYHSDLMRQHETINNNG